MLLVQFALLRCNFLISPCAALQFSTVEFWKHRDLSSEGVLRSEFHNNSWCSDIPSCEQMPLSDSMLHHFGNEIFAATAVSIMMIELLRKAKASFRQRDICSNGSQVRDD